MADNSKKISELPIASNVASTDRVLVLRTPASNASVRTVTVQTLISSLTELAYANSSVAGIVKVGNNLSINATGHLNVVDWLSYANDSVAGTVKVGNNLSVNATGYINYDKNKSIVVLSNTTPYIIADEDIVIVDAGAAGGNVEVIFPPTNSEGRTVTVKTINTDVNTITISIEDNTMRLENPASLSDYDASVDLSQNGKFGTWTYNNGYYRCIGISI